MDGGTSSLQILNRALAKMPVLTSTWKGEPPPDVKPYKLPGSSPQDDVEYYRQLCEWPEPRDDRSEPSEEWFSPHDDWFDPHEEDDLGCYTGYD